MNVCNVLVVNCFDVMNKLSYHVFIKKVGGAFNGFEWFSVLKAEKD